MSKLVWHSSVTYREIPSLSFFRELLVRKFQLMKIFMFEQSVFLLNVVFSIFIRKQHIIYSFISSLHHVFGIGSLPSWTSKISSLIDYWKVIDINWSSQCPMVIAVGIQFSLSEIWLAKNKARFEELPSAWKKSIKSIVEVVILVGNNPFKSVGASITEFVWRI